MALTKVTTEVLDVPGLTVALAADATANGVKSKLDLKANLASPALTGIPTAPTAVNGTDTTQLATTAFVTSSPAFTGIPTAPTAANGTDTTQLATTAFVTSSPTFTGVPVAPTAVAGTNTTQLATTAFVHTATIAGSGLGYGQTWQNLTASRAFATTYTNSTSKPIVVNVGTAAASLGGAQIQATVGGVGPFSIGADSNSNGGYSPFGHVIVPPGLTYRITASGTAGYTVGSWYELR